MVALSHFFSRYSHTNRRRDLSTVWWLVNHYSRVCNWSVVPIQRWCCRPRSSSWWRSPQCCWCSCCFLACSAAAPETLSPSTRGSAGEVRARARARAHLCLFTLFIVAFWRSLLICCKFLLRLWFVKFVLTPLVYPPKFYCYCIYILLFSRYLISFSC